MKKKPFMAEFVCVMLAIIALVSAEVPSIQVGSLRLSQMGCGTWSWGNTFLWGYNENNDASIQQTYDYITSRGINWFDTADSYVS